MYFPSEKSALPSLQFIEKTDYEIIRLLINEDENFANFARHCQAGAMRKDTVPDFYLQPQFSVEWTPEKLRKEFLRAVFVLGRGGPEGWGKELDFIRNAFFRYNAREICQQIPMDWMETLRGLHMEKRSLTENSKLLAKKIEFLRIGENEQERKPRRDSRLFLQADASSERYLDYRQQLAANRILLNEYQNSLQMNDQRVSIAHKIMQTLEKISFAYLDRPSLPMSHIDDFLKKEIAGSAPGGLKHELLGLQLIFRQIQKTSSSANIPPASIPRKPFFYLKYFALYLFVTALFLLAVGLLDMLKRRND